MHCLQSDMLVHEHWSLGFAILPLDLPHNMQLLLSAILRYGFKWIWYKSYTSIDVMAITSADPVDVTDINTIRTIMTLPFWPRISLATATGTNPIKMTKSCLRFSIKMANFITECNNIICQVVNQGCKHRERGWGRGVFVQWTYVKFTLTQTTKGFCCLDILCFKFISTFKLKFLTVFRRDLKVVYSSRIHCLTNYVTRWQIFSFALNPPPTY